MFGQPSFGGFGQSQAAPAFGSTPTSSPFGGSTAFGSTQPSPFGASTGTGVFGASQPAFGAASTPAFGAPQTQGGMFGSSAFGAKPAGGFAFGGTSTGTAPFGASSQPAFGAPASTPSFGGFGASSTPAFGAAASTPAFGAASTPAFGGFGASSTPAFGSPAPSSAFGTPGSSPFGATPSTPAFGAAAPAQQQNMGSRVTPYLKHQDKDTSSSSAAATTVYYTSISAMPTYANKSVEELRWEDYQAGVKNASSAPTPAAAGGFGAPAAAAAPAAGGFGFGGASTGGAFGLGQSSPSPFGASSTPAFGASSPSPFGAGGFGSTPAASTPAFGGFGAAASTPATGTGLFGASASQPAAGGFSFGGSSTPAFGAPASSASAFGASSTPSLFGGSTFGASSGGLFGASSTPAFGAATSSPSPFGAASTPSFGAPGSSPFGAAAPAQSTGAFGAASTGFSFGAPAAAAAKPATGGFSFGSTPASGGLFGAPASTGSLFGASSAPAFGTTGGSLFGSTPSSNPASGSSLFGGTSAFGATPASGGLFGGPASAPAFSGFGAAPAAAAAPVQPATVGQQPYGALQPLPSVNVPEHKVGITQRPIRAAVTSMRPSPLLTLRTTTPKFGLGTAANGYNKPGSLTAASASGSPYSLSTGTTSSPAAAADGVRPGSPGAALLLPVRDNPHRLFIRTPPPATTPAANGSSFSPAMTRVGGGGSAGVEESTPMRTPATRRSPQQVSPAAAATPDTTKTTDKPSSQQQQQQQSPASGPSSKQPADQSAAAAGRSAEDASQKQQRTKDAAAADGDDEAPSLGALVKEGYSLEPSVRELQGLARKNSAALSRVPGFKIKREGYGSLEWQQPVDVRGLNLEDVVQIERGEVSLYLNNSAEKPPIGSGLNCQCRVTLEGVYKKSKNQQQQSDAAAVAAFRKRLMRYCSEMGARFIDYKPDGGVWMFEVDHFSRYGLPVDTDSDHDDECMADGEHDQDFETSGKATSQEPELTFGGPAYSDDGDMEEAAAVDGDADVTQQPRQQQQQQHFGSDFAGRAANDDQDEQQQQQGKEQGMAFGSVPLQHALPALLGHKAGSLMELRGAFFRRGGTEELTAAQHDLAAAAAESSVSPMTVDLAGFGFQRQQQQAEHVLPQHNWIRPRAALLQQRQQQQQQQQQQLVLFGTDAQALQQQQGTGSSYSPAATLLVPPMLSRELQSQRRQPSSSAAAAAAAGRLLPSSVAVGNSGLIVDASLMLGRSFRVGWGPNGVLAIPQNPGLSDGGNALAGPSSGFRLSSYSSNKQKGGGSGCKAEELGVPCIELRQLNAMAAVAGSSSSGSSGGGGLAAFVGDADAGGRESAAAAADTLRRRVLAGLDLHYQYSSMSGSSTAAADSGAADVDMKDLGQQKQPQGGSLAAGGSTVQWQLQVTSNNVAEYVQQQVDGLNAAAAAAAAGSSDGSVADIAGRGLHSVELWQLLKVLYESIEGEDDPSSSSNVNALLPAAALEDALEREANGSSSSSRRQLAAMQRKANISRWLQRKLKPQIEAALAELLGSSSSGQQQDQDVVLWSLLHLMSGRQVAAAVSVAAAVGDARLATLLAAAGQAAAGIGGKHLGTQLKSWARAGILPSHISTPRRLLLLLLAAAGTAAGGLEGLVEVSTALGLDWSRAYGLWFWYGVPFTEPVDAVTTAFTTALASSTALPRPVPPHAAASSSKGLNALLPPPQQQQSLVLYGQQQQQQQRAKVHSNASDVAFAAADTQYALLQLYARGAYGLGVGLLDSSSSSSGDSWRDQGVGVSLSKLLRVAGYSSNPLDYSTAWQLLLVLESLKALPSKTEEYENVTMNIVSCLLSQLLLLGPAAAPWAMFVALHLPDHSQLGSYYRDNALQQLLNLTVQQWSQHPDTISKLRDNLQMPLRWLHEAQAVWYGYCHHHCLQLLHLIAAGNWQQAHDLACKEVLPLLARAAVMSAGGGAAAAAVFIMAARSFLAAAGSSVPKAAAAAAADGVQSGTSDESWSDVGALHHDPSAAVAAAAHVAAMCVAAAGLDSSSSCTGSGVLQEQEVQNPARVASITLRALTWVFGIVSGGLGPGWSVGGGVYAAWCGLFLNPKGELQDPAIVAAAAAADGASVSSGVAPAGEAVERCLYLADLLAGVAAATDGSSGSSMWWRSPLQRAIQARMTADVGKALVRLGVSSSSGGGQQQQQHAPLLVPLAAAGFVGGGQSAAQMLAGAAADVTAGMYVV